MTSTAAVAAPLDLGRVIQDIVTVLRRNFVRFLILSAILSGVPAVLLGFVQMRLIAGGSLGGVVQAITLGLVSMVAGLVLQGALIYGTVSDMNGRPASVGDCLTVGLRNFLALFAIGLLLGLAIMVGLILFIVPGVLLALAWCVAVPAFVAERLDVFDAFGRSADLTRGNRWRLLALFLLYAVISMIVQGVLVAVFAVAGAGAGSALRLELVHPLVAIINALIGATGAAVLYVELRRARDGVGPQDLAAVFD